MKNKTFKIFITKKLPYDPTLLISKDKYDVKYDVEIYDDEQKGQITKEELKEKIKYVDAIISMLSDKLDSDVLSSAKNLKIIAQYAVGYNNIDIEYCKKNNIVVTNTPDVLTHASAELAFGLLLSCSRKLKSAFYNVDQNNWTTWGPQILLGKSLQGKKLGIIGAGKIGRQMAKFCKAAFDMEIFYFQRNQNHEFEKELLATYLPLDNLLKEVDIVSIHTPLNNESRHLLNGQNLKLMKDDAIIINTARGEVIDEQALIYELEQDRFFAVGLDVTEIEPLPISSSLRKIERVTITPHIASATIEARTEMAKLCISNISLVLDQKVAKTSVTY